MNISFKIASLEHLDYLLEGHKDAAKWLKSKDLDHWQQWHNPNQTMIADVKDGILKKEFYLVENVNALCLGAFRLMKSDPKYWPLKKDKAYYIHNFFINRAHAKQNIGSSVLKKIQCQAEMENIQYFRLDCLASNKELCRYYESQGFKKTGRILDGRVFNVLYEKQLHQNH